MTLKEKLELLWKYLLLVVIVYGLAQIGNVRHGGMMTHDFPRVHGERMMWFDDDDCDEEEMNVEVEIEKLAGGDSTITVIINGETMDLDDLDKLGENVFIKKMRHDGDRKERKVKIIKKTMSDK